jgi:Holliday junction resolvasome RuvABC DNA-binding subunit
MSGSIDSEDRRKVEANAQYIMHNISDARHRYDLKEVFVEGLKTLGHKKEEIDYAVRTFFVAVN